MGKLRNASNESLEMQRGKQVRNPPILATDLSSCTGVRPNLSPERMNFLNDKLLHSLDRVLIFKPKVEFGGAHWFIGRIVPDLKVRVVQRLFAGDSLRRIEVQHPGQQIDRERVCMGDEGGERNTRFDRERADILLSTGRTNAPKSILRWCPQVV